MRPGIGPLRIAVAVLAIAAVVIPTTAMAASEHILIPIENEPAPWEFDDPCTGEAVHGLGIENGVLWVTDLGDQGIHVRVDVRGEADLYNAGGELVGRWTYRLHFGNQFPPDGQGADHMTASGPLEYANGSTAIVHVFHSHVFAKGDTEKRVRDWASCGGNK